MDLDAVLLDAIRPRNLRERLAAAVGRGLSPAQVLDRLPEDARAALLVGDNLVAARREAIEKVAARLAALARDGVLAHATRKVYVDRRGPGVARIEVDTYRLL